MPPISREESSIYCPPEFIDGEEGAGNIINGSWREDEDPCGGLDTLGRVLVVTDHF